MRRSALLSLVTALALAASTGVPASALGAAGTLDRSFGAAGVVGTPNAGRCGSPEATRRT